MYSEIVGTINSAIDGFVENRKPATRWREPIVGVVSAYDECFLKLKKVVSSEHYLPDDILSGARGIVSYFVPNAEEVVLGNAKGRIASREWALAYLESNELIDEINKAVGELMAKAGYQTGKTFLPHSFDDETLLSRWSHRHIAHAAGLGTFGINNMLITASGCCGRFGTIVTDCEFGEYGEPAHEEKCLSKRDGSCGICQKKCPANAFENGVYDKHRCYELCLENAEVHKKLGYADVCGKCMAGVPCSLREPEQKQNRSK